jgi:Putative lumazine-binding
MLRATLTGRKTLTAVAWLATAVLLAATPATPAAPSEADRAAITQTALDYIEGWYEGNAERMERALHPDLAKRIVRTTPDGRARVDHMGALSLVQGTRSGWGKKTPPDKQQKDVTLLDVYGNAASVKVVASEWIDYLHMGKVNGRWVIVNVLWELKPEVAAARAAEAAKPPTK